MRKIRVGKALLEIAELPSDHDLMMQYTAERLGRRRRRNGPAVVRAPRPAGSGVGRHETWRCKAPHCREWVIPSRARIDGCCHVCDTPKDAGQEESRSASSVS